MCRAAVVGAALVSASILCGQAAWALITPVPVHKAPASQLDPSRNATYLAFSSNSVAHPRRWNAYASPLDGAGRTRLNAAGTQGFAGGFDPAGTNVVVYQQVEGASSDIYSFDLDARVRTQLAGVNTPKREWSPRVSSSYYAFFRDFRSGGVWYTRLLLYDRATLRLLRIATYNAGTYASLGSVGDRYVAWSICTRKTCSAFVYDAVAGTLRKIPTRRSKPQYDPVVDEANAMVFFLRSGFGCGLGARFLSAPLDTLRPSTRIAALRSGVDVQSESLSLNPDTGRFDLVFARVPCATGNGDIYRLSGVSPGGP